MQENINAEEPMDEFFRLENALLTAQEAVRTWQDRGENPASVYSSEKQAQDALNAWCESHRDLYEAEVARRKAAAEAHRAEVLKDVDIWGI